MTTRVASAAVPALILVFALASASDADPRTTAPLRFDAAALEADLDRYVPAAMQTEHVPGVSVAVVQHGAIVLAKGYGNAAKDLRVTTATVFQAASLGKPLTAFAALRLCELGKLSLDTPLASYVTVPFVDAELGGRDITLRHVLSHTSGLSNNMIWRDRRLRFVPGSRFAYSGVGFQYLQAAIETATGLPFNEAMAMLVFRPLRMNSSSYVDDPALQPLLARGYFSLGSWQLPLPAVAMYRAPNAASSLYSTPTDLARFTIALMHPEDGDRGLTGAMLTPQVRVDDRVSWGLGIGLEHNSGGDVFWQWGSNPGFKSLIVGYPKHELAVVVMSNGSNGLQLLRPIAQRALGGDYGVYWDAMSADSAAIGQTAR